MQTHLFKTWLVEVFFIQFQIVEKVVVVVSTDNKSCQNNAKPHFSVERTYNNFFVVFQVLIMIIRNQ